ncbi:MAG: TetR/AcrR family transcriptional regulator [Acidimicrobiales bacterium]
MPKTARRRLSPDQRRAEFVELGLSVLTDRSLDDVSMADLASMAGASEGLVWHYFPSKRDFQAAVARAVGARLLAATRADTSLAGPAQLQEALTGYVRHVEAHHGAYLSLVRGAAGGDATLRQVRNDTLDLLARRVSTVIWGDGGAPSEAGLLVRGWFGFVEEATVLWVEERSVSERDLVDLFVDLLFHVAGRGKKDRS